MSVNVQLEKSNSACVLKILQSFGCVTFYKEVDNQRDMIDGDELIHSSSAT